jgi:hypothetical protein
MTGYPQGLGEFVQVRDHGRNYVRDDLAGQNIQGKLTAEPPLIWSALAVR